MDQERSQVGVIIGRFQLPQLHTEHKKLIQYVLDRHKKVILFLGVPLKLGTKRNPLDFTSRKYMVEEEFGNKLVILPLSDNPSDEEWSKQLDLKVREVFPQESVTLYGSKDSFIPYYHGEFKCESLVPDNYVSATDIREQCSKEILSSMGFRAGIIYAVYNYNPE